LLLKASRNRGIKRALSGLDLLQIDARFAMAQTIREIDWQRDFESALGDAKGRHVLLDFSAAPM
jgi:hypothetical protein